MKTYIIESKNTKVEHTAKNIANLRQWLILNTYPHSGKYKVYSENGKYLGSFDRGMNDGFWMTPKGGYYVLNRDGTFWGSY